MLCFLCRRLLRWLDCDHADWSSNSQSLAWIEGAGERLASLWWHGVDDASLWSVEVDYDRLSAASAALDTDAAAAVREFRSLAADGSVMAMAYLGWALQVGRGTDLDEGEAIEWYERASDAGSDYARLQLVYLAYARRDFEETEALAGPAIAKGLTPAMRIVALSNLRLRRTPDARRMARELLERASAKGDLAARRDLAKARALGKFGWNEVRPGMRAWKAAASDMVAWLRAEHAREVADRPAEAPTAGLHASEARSKPRKSTANISFAEILLGRAAAANER